MTEESDVTTRVSPRTVQATVERLLRMLEAKGLKLFSVIDQQAEAQAVGLQLRATTIILFGNPALGTPVMDAAPLAGLDLPLKVMVWSDDGATKVSYVAPDALAKRHRLTDELRDNLAGIESLVQSLVAD
jgi:uncharacterized protein (DUF302 family)